MRILIALLFLIPCVLHAGPRITPIGVQSCEPLRQDPDPCEAEFHRLIDEVVDPFQVYFSEVNRRLVDKTVFLDIVRDYSEIQSGTAGVMFADHFRAEGQMSWIMAVYGRLLNLDTGDGKLSRDGFQLVICHELGHWLGGVPAKHFQSGVISVENQADYWSTQVCAKEIWSNQDNSPFLDYVRVATEGPVIQSRCDAVWETGEERALCYRTLIASRNIISYFSSDISFSKRSPEFYLSDWIDTGYHSPQCRLDSLAAGALCKINKQSYLRGESPGLYVGNRGFENGYLSGRAARDFGSDTNQGFTMIETSCTQRSGNPEGVRPSCWFKL